MAKTTERKPTAVPTAAEEKAMTGAAKSDSDAKPVTATHLTAMVPVRGLRGRPKSAKSKQLVSFRYSPEVLVYFKRAGKGWQSRMDRVLRQYGERKVRPA